MSSRLDIVSLALALALILALSSSNLVAAAVVRVSPSRHGFSSSSSALANDTAVSWHPSPAAQHTCRPMTAALDPTLDAASWKQCAALYSRWVSENGTFGVANLDGPARSRYRALVHQPECALSVAPLASTDGPYLVGSKDIEALLRNSLQNYSSGSLLAANGTLECDVATGGRAPMSWRISKPEP